MKKRFVLFLLAALLISCLSISASAEGTGATIANVVDTAGILTESQVQALQEKAARHPMLPCAPKVFAHYLPPGGKSG